MKQNENNKTKRNLLTAEQIAEKGICTTTVDVDFDIDFFNHYSIVSYFNTKQDKYIPYDRIGSCKVLSVTGIKERWISGYEPFNRFFVMTEKDAVMDVLQDLCCMSNISAKVDTLSTYDELVKKRIIVSLLINSLNKYKEKKLTYNYGRLYVMDEQNFHLKKKKDEIVCLSIEVNKFLVLTANTVTLSKCKSLKTLEEYHRRRACFKSNHALLGDKWSGDVLSAFIYKKGIDVNLDEIYIQKKRNRKQHNIVSQYTWNEIELYDDKNGVKCEILRLINEHYGRWVKLSFCQYPLVKYGCYTSSMFRKDKDQLTDFYFKDKPVYIENPIIQVYPQSESFVEDMKTALECAAGFPINFVPYIENDYTDGMVLKIAVEKPENNSDSESDDDDNPHMEDDSYTRNEDLSRYSVLQHCVYREQDDQKIKSSDKSSNNLVTIAKKIIIEMMVKEIISKKILHSSLASAMEGWNCFLFKEIDKYIYGASMSSSQEGSVHFDLYNGLEDEENDTDHSSFIQDVLEYRKIPKWMDFSNIYRVLQKGGNTYLIIDTDENPIVDAAKIEHLYIAHNIKEKNETGKTESYQKNAINEMRTVGNIHDYMKGVFGYRIWARSPLVDNLPTYSYLVGVNTGKNLLQTKKSQKFPRTKRIIVLQANDKDLIPVHLEEMETMMKQIFGRYNEMECYPFPFKFLQEYLERNMLRRRGIHWSELNKSTLNH